MKFPVMSTATITRRCARFAFRVMQRSSVAHLIARGGVFNCRQTSGTNSWSPHAFGDAIDLFPEHDIGLRRIALNVFAQATKRTIANRGVTCPVVHIIYHDNEWIRGKGWRHYDGVFHSSHVHVGFSFSTTRRPPCA